MQVPSGRNSRNEPQALVGIEFLKWLQPRMTGDFVAGDFVAEEGSLRFETGFCSKTEQKMTD